MNIALSANEHFPYGRNIHFALELNTFRLRYVHPAFQWAVSDENGTSTDAFIAKLQSEDLPVLKETFHEIATGQYQGTVKVALETPAGHQWVQITPLAISQEGQQLIIGSVIDVTDEVNNYLTVEKYANKKNSILNMLGHDLRGPLNIANTIVKMLEEEITEPGMLKKTQYIAGVLSESIELISNLISREFLETSKIVLVKRRIDIVQKLKEYVEECRLSEDIAERKFSLTSSADRIILKIDEAKLMQVMNNLISNALKFTRPSGQISIDLLEEADHVKISFTDDGIGMPAHIVPTIFNQYSGGGRTGLQGEPSTGLGLSIVKTIIEWHKGTIQCKSKEGSGTTFEMRFPKL